MPSVLNIYSVTVAYQTKRGRIAVMMTIQAATEDEAMKLGRHKIFHGYPARHFVYAMAKCMTTPQAEGP